MSNIVERALVIFLVMAAAAFEVSVATVYKVGDSAGWTTLGNIDYKKWAANKNFQLEDVILFEYNTKFHNVMEVKHTDYSSCNVSSPFNTYTTGNDSITIKRYGHYYFLCGVPGHCQSGQKVDIRVARPSASAPTPAASSGGSIAPGPSTPKNSAPSHLDSSMLGGLAISFFAAIVYGFAF